VVKPFLGSTHYSFATVLSVTEKKCDVEKQLTDWFADAKKVVIAGIGNPIRFDDFVGIKIVMDLQGKIPENVRLLECETVPESYLLDIEEFNPTHVLLIDAAFLELMPGDACLFSIENVPGFSAVSSHILPLRVFSEYIRQSTGAKIGLLLIQPKNVEFGEGLSLEVEVAAERMAGLLLDLLSKV
jgi:hydrogenase 3 maturation protease